MARRGWRDVVAVVGVLVAFASGACAQEANGERVLPDRAGGGGGGGGGDGPSVGDHWHTAFGIYVCGDFLPPVPEWHDTVGIHTHDDDVVHIHPFVEEASGERATLELFLDGADVELDEGRLVVDGEVYEDGAECDGQPAVIQVAQWDDARAGGAPELVQDDASGLRFRRDGEAFTVAVVPEGSDIPLPESVDILDDLSGDTPTGPSVSTTAPRSTATTIGA